MSIQTRSQIRELLERHGIHPSRTLGQHFLADPNLVRKIVATASLSATDQVLEIGPGTGTLTAGLAATGARVVAYEVDQRLRPLLAETLAGLDRVDVRFADVTKVDLEAELEGSGWVLVANLPYNVGTPLLLDILRSVPTIQRMVVMVQREVADRLVAGPGSSAYGLPSLTARLYADVRLAFTVPPQVFVPRPQVESGVVSLVRIEVPAGAERAIELAAAAFRQRRKMLRTALSGLGRDPEDRLAAARIAPNARPEELSPQDYLRLAEVWDA